VYIAIRGILDAPRISLLLEMANGWVAEFAASVNPSARAAGVSRTLDRCIMNLAIWLPLLFALGLAVFGLMFGCVVACDKV
jgi:uncharacterized membrane protein YedE/YeeE